MSNTETITDIDFTLLSQYSTQLAKKVELTGFIPEHILYIERAGLFIGYDISQYFHCPISGISSSRRGASFKSALKVILRLLPRKLNYFLRNLERRSNVHGLMSDRKVICEGISPPRDKRILLVDDAIDTGFTIRAVIDYLNNNGWRMHSIKVAVITTTEENPVIQPDMSLFTQRFFAFPWSYDSREYTAAWKLYESKKAQIYQ